MTVLQEFGLFFTVTVDQTKITDTNPFWKLVDDAISLHLRNRNQSYAQEEVQRGSSTNSDTQRFHTLPWQVLEPSRILKGVGAGAERCRSLRAHPNATGNNFDSVMVAKLGKIWDNPLKKGELLVFFGLCKLVAV